MRGRCITGAGRCSSHSTGNEHHLKGRGNAALRPNPSNERTENRPIQGRGGTSSSHRATRPGRTAHGGGTSRTSPFRSEQSRRSPHRTNEPPNSASDIRTVSCPPLPGGRSAELFPQRRSRMGERFLPALLSSRLREEGSCARRRRAEVGGRDPLELGERSRQARRGSNSVGGNFPPFRRLPSPALPPQAEGETLLSSSLREKGPCATWGTAAGLYSTSPGMSAATVCRSAHQIRPSLASIGRLLT